MAHSTRRLLITEIAGIEDGEHNPHGRCNARKSSEEKQPPCIGRQRQPNTTDEDKDKTREDKRLALSANIRPYSDGESKQELRESIGADYKPH